MSLPKLYFTVNAVQHFFVANFEINDPIVSWFADHQRLFVEFENTYTMSLYQSHVFPVYSSVFFWNYLDNFNQAVSQEVLHVCYFTLEENVPSYE